MPGKAGKTSLFSKMKAKMRSSSSSFHAFDEYESRPSGFGEENPMARRTAPSQNAPSPHPPPGPYVTPPMPSNAPIPGHEPCNGTNVELEMKDLHACNTRELTKHDSSGLRDTVSSIPRFINLGGSSIRNLTSSFINRASSPLSNPSDLDSIDHDAMMRDPNSTSYHPSNSLLPITNDAACCPPPCGCCSYYYNHPESKVKKYTCRGCVYFWLIYLLFLTWSICDLLPLLFEDNPDNLYRLNFVRVNDVCDATYLPYDVDVDFMLPFNGELVHVNEIDFTVFKNNNPDKIPGHIDKARVTSSSFTPLWDGSNILRGGDSKMVFASSAVLHDLDVAGELATNMMNEYDFQAITSLKVPIFTARLMFPIWYTTEVDIYYTCGFSDVDSYGKECNSNWSLTKKSLSCEYVCQFEDYPIRPMKYWYPSLYAEDHGVDAENFAIPDAKDAAGCAPPTSSRRRRLHRQLLSPSSAPSLFPSSTSTSSPRRSLSSSSAYYPDYTLSMDPLDPKYELQKLWQENRYCDAYKSFCSYSEVIRSVEVWSDTDDVVAEIPTRSNMVTPNITMLLGELPIIATVPPLDLDIFYSNLDILPDAPNSPVFTKDRMAKARSHTIQKTTDWEISFAADAFIAGPEGSEGTPTPGQLKDLQDSIDDFLSLNDMFVYVRGSQNSEIEETCDLQKLIARMPPMRIMMYSNLTQELVCEASGDPSEDQVDDSSVSPSPSPPSPPSNATRPPPTTACPFGTCLKYKQIEQDPFYMTRIDLLSVEPPSIFALANFSLNLPFLVYGDIPTIVMDVNSGNDPFCVVEISPFQLENKGNEANPNIPTFAHVNLTVVDSRMFMDKMAAMNSIDEMELWVSGSNTVGLDSPYFFSLLSTMMKGFTLPVGDLITNATAAGGSGSVAPAPAPVPVVPIPADLPPPPKPFLNFNMDSSPSSVVMSISALLSSSFFPLPVAFSTRDLVFSFNDDLAEDTCGTFSIPGPVPLKAFCSFTLDPGYCTYGGDNYINMSLSVAGNQGDCLRNMIQNVTEQKMGKMSHPVSLVDGEVTYPDHWHMSPTLVASSTVLADCESEIVLSCPSSAASDAKEAVACLTDPQTVTRPQQACSDALLRKGTISAELEDIWDIAHMMQMYNFKKKERIPYTSACEAPCPYSNPEHWYFVAPDDEPLFPSAPSVAPSASVSTPSPPFKLSAFNFNNFMTVDDPLDMDCILEAYEGLRTFKTSHCKGLDEMSFDLSLGVEVFVGMQSLTDDIDFDFALNSLSVVIQYVNSSASVTALREPTLARLRLKDLTAINDLKRGLGGGARNISFNAYNVARLAEFVGQQNEETIRIYFDEDLEEGDMLSSILSLPAFAMTFDPPNVTRISDFADFELEVGYPMVICPPGTTSSNCYIVNNLDIQTTEIWGGELADQSTVFANNGDTLSVFGEGYYQRSAGSDAFTDPSVMKVVLRQISGTSTADNVVYDNSRADNFPVRCSSIASSGSDETLDSTSSTVLTVSYTLPEGNQHVGLYDVMATISSDYSGCDEHYASAFGSSNDGVKIVSQVAILSTFDSDEDGNGDGSFPAPPGPSNPAIETSRNHSRPLSTLAIELNSTVSNVGLYNHLEFDKFDSSWRLEVPALDLELVNIPLVGVVPDVPEEISNAMDDCHNNGGDCSILDMAQSEVHVDGMNSFPTFGSIRAIVADDGTTDLFNQVVNEGLGGKPVGLSLQGIAGERPFKLKFVPFRVPQSARSLVDTSGDDSSSGGGRRKLLHGLVKEQSRRNFRSREQISEEDVFDAVSGFDLIDPWLRNTSIYKKTDIALTGVELLILSTLNTSFDTHWKDTDEPFLFYTETLTNFSTDIFQDLFSIDLTLPTISFETPVALQGYNFSNDEDWHGFGEVDNTELEMTPFAELRMFGGTWSSNDPFALIRQSWMMINNTLIDRGLGEIVSRNQNMTFRAQGAPGGDTLLERMLRYVRFDYLFPALAVNRTASGDLGALSTVTLPTQTGGVVFQFLNMGSADASLPSNSRVVASPNNMQVSGEFRRLEEAGCTNCLVQVHLGFVDSLGISRSQFQCVYHGDPDEEGDIVYTFSGTLSTPSENGDYFLVAVVVFDYSCSASFNVGVVGKAASGKRVGSLRVEGGGRRLSNILSHPKAISACDPPKTITNGSATFCIQQGSAWVTLSSSQPQPHVRLRILDDIKSQDRRIDGEEGGGEGTYKGTEGLRVVGGLYSDENSIAINSTINVWPHIYANVPVDFHMGAISLDFFDVARNTKLLDFVLDEIDMPAALGGKIFFELTAKGEKVKNSLTDFIEDLFDPTVNSRKIKVSVRGTMKGSLGTRDISLGVIISQAAGRGYFDIQEQSLRRMLRTKMMEVLRYYLPMIPEEAGAPEELEDNPFDVVPDTSNPFRSLIRIFEDDETSDPDDDPYGGSIAKVDIIGGSSIGSDVRLPCVVDFACPPLSESEFGAATDVLVMAEYSFIIPGGLEVHFDIPEISLDVDCCVYTKLLSVTLASDTISNAQLDRPFIGITKIEIDDAELMYQSFTSIGTTFAPVYRIHGNPNGNMLSKIISTVEFKYDMTPNTGQNMMCKDDTWITYNQLECYKLFASPTKTYSDAQSACEVEGGNLLHIVDEDMNNWISTEIFMSSSVASAFVGLDDQIVDGVWRWENDGTTGGFTNWDSNALSSSGNCALLKDDGLWTPALCATAASYICEVDAIPWSTPGTPAATVSPSPTQAPTSLDEVCPALVPEGSNSIAAVNSWITFFYPTKCQGTWRLSETDTENAYFEIVWPGVALPVQVLLPTCSITLTYEGIEVATITPGSTNDLVFQNDGTTAFLKVHIYGDPALENVICMGQDYVEDKTKCQLAKMIDTLLKGAMETGGPLSLGIVIKYDHPFEEYGTQAIKLDISLFQEAALSRPQPGQDSVIVDPTRAPTPANSYCNVKFDEIDSQELLGSGVTVKRTDYMGNCCNECANDFVEIYSDVSVDATSSALNSWDVFWNGVTLYLKVEICNVFPFPIQASRLKADASFMDQDGCQFSWIPGGTHDAKEDVSIAEGVVWSDEVNPLVVPAGVCMYTPMIEINAPVTLEIVTRLADEAMYKRRLCLTIKNMVVDMGLGSADENAAVFKWTQPLDLKRISTLGFNDCVRVPTCENVVGVKVEQNFDSSMWSVNSPGGEVSISSSSNMRLHWASGPQGSSAFLLQQHNMLDDWQIDFTVKVTKSNSWGTHGGQFGFVAQNKGATEIGSTDAFSGLGAGSLGVIFDVWDDTGKVFKNGGVDETANQIGRTDDVDDVTNGQFNSYRVTYNAYHKVLAFYFNSGTEIVSTMAPKMTIQEDLNTVFTTNLGYAWIGFGVRVGSGSWTRIETSSFKLSSVKTSIAHSRIEEDKLALPISGSFVVDAKGSCGTYRFSGGDLWVIVLKNEAAGVEYNVPSSGIADLGTGRYTVTYSLPIAGDYVVWASLSNDFSGEGQGQLEIGSFTAS